LRAAKIVAAELGRSVTLCGTEVDPEALAQARASGLSDADLAGVALRDFIEDPPPGRSPGLWQTLLTCAITGCPRHAKRSCGRWGRA
jgi:hypothetical protein